MKRAYDLAGQRYGCLVAIEYSHADHSGAWWKCRCDCGNTKLVRACSLRAGNTQSCGCKRVESSRARAFGGKRGMHTRMVLAEIFAKEAPREVDRSEKSWAGAESAVQALQEAWP